MLLPWNLAKIENQSIPTTLPWLSLGPGMIMKQNYTLIWSCNGLAPQRRVLSDVMDDWIWIENPVAIGSWQSYLNLTPLMTQPASKLVRPIGWSFSVTDMANTQLVANCSVYYAGCTCHNFMYLSVLVLILPSLRSSWCAKAFQKLSHPQDTRLNFRAAFWWIRMHEPKQALPHSRPFILETVSPTQKWTWL